MDRCPQCKRPIGDALERPFCSERCRLLDLASWLDGRFRLPGESIDPESGETDPDHEEKPIKH